MFNRILALALSLAASAGSMVTGVPSSIENDPNVNMPFLRPHGKGGADVGMFRRQGGTHGSTRRRRFKMLKNKARRA